MHIPFRQTPDGLVAESDQARLRLSPLHGDRAIDGVQIVEDTECNVLVHVRAEGRIALTLNGEPTRGFVREGHALWGRIATGDRPGVLAFRVLLNDREVLRADLTVRPAKLDAETDYAAMRADIERICRDLLYAMPQQARVSVDLAATDGAPLDFLLLANRLLDRLLQTLHTVCKHPDQRLRAHTTERPISLATGRDPDALAYLVRTPSAWIPDPPWPIHPLPVPGRRIGCATLRETRRVPTPDTPANRHLVARLNRLCRRADALARRLPDPHAAQCRNMGARLNRCVRSTRLQHVPPARPTDAVPRFLTPPYQRAFTLIADLDRALAPAHGGPFDLSFRDTPTLYEYWTWFTLVHTFCDLGFAPQATPLFRLVDRGLIVSPAQGELSAIDLQTGRQRVRCLYNPTYTAASGRTLTHDLRPDIVVEVHSQTRTVHAFDAKYRREDAGGYWIPLRDDIDKMHAYRDAIGQVASTEFERILKSAIVLFPAPADPAYHNHPFHKSLPHGIGGLPLMPGDRDTLRALRDHLIDRVLR